MRPLLLNKLLARELNEPCSGRHHGLYYRDRLKIPGPWTAERTGRKCTTDSGTFVGSGMKYINHFLYETYH